MMTCNTLILFTNDSGEHAKELLAHFNSASVNAICLNDIPENLQPSYVQKLSKSKLNVIFFSPGFLKFLESKPLDACYICNQLEPKSIISVFCCGLNRSDVRCYHLAVLEAFKTCKKFDIVKQRRRDTLSSSVFPDELINRISGVINVENEMKEQVSVIPQYVHKENNIGYLIFQNPVENLDDISIQLENEMENEIFLEKTNPFVLKFIFPEFLFQYSHSVNVVVCRKSTVIATEKVYVTSSLAVNLNPVLPASDKTDSLVVKDRISKRESMLLDEQLNFVVDFSEKASYMEKQDSFASDSDIFQRSYSKTKEKKAAENEAIEESLTKLCEKYGLEELCEQYLNEEATMSLNRRKTKTLKEDKTTKEIDEMSKNNRDSKVRLPEMDDSYQMNSFFVDDPNILNIRRSLSLPSTLIPAFSERESYAHYMDMTGGEITEERTKPHERLIQNMKRHRISSSCDENFPGSPSLPGSPTYVSMNMSTESYNEKLSLLKKDLSHSQQELLELLHQFKLGEVTDLDVEDQFQAWWGRHRNTDALKEKCRKTSIFPWKNHNSKAKKKDNAIQEKKYTSTWKEAKKKLILTRKTSNTSASSNSSKTSLSTQKPVIELLSPPVTGWVSSYCPDYDRLCGPLYSERYAPPLPKRPPPSPPLKTLKPPTRPVPFPRKCNLAKNTVEYENISILKTKGATSEDNQKDKDNSHDSSLQDLVYLCEKYGLDELGECFLSGTRTLEPHNAVTRTSKKFDSESQVISSEEVDIDGYEIPLETIRREYHRISGKRSLRRSISLPSNFHRSTEYTDIDLSTDTSGDRSYANINTDFRKSFNCNSTSDELDTFTKNLYEPLKKRKSSDKVKEENTDVCLNNSQQELLELMYAFKSGEKTISQVEEQFQDWHSRHGGSQEKFVCRFHQDKTKQEKMHKHSGFTILGLKSLILGKPKKVYYREKQSPETVLKKTKPETSDSSSISTNAQKRLSKTSNTSSSSGSSDQNEVFRLHKDGGSSSDISETQLSSNTQFRRKPLPPLPHNANELVSNCQFTNIENVAKPLPPLPPLSPNTNELVSNHQFVTDRETVTKPSLSKPPRKKPMPLPKPKILLNARTAETRLYHSLPRLSHHNLQKDSVPEKDATEPPSSPDYIIPESFKFSKHPRKKVVEKGNNTTAKKTFDKQIVPLQVKHNSPIKNDSKTQPPLTIYNDDLDITGNKKVAVSQKVLPPQTLLLLKEANLVSNPEEEKLSRFYIRRCSSFPNIGVSLLPNEPIYIEILGPIA